MKIDFCNSNDRKYHGKTYLILKPRSQIMNKISDRVQYYLLVIGVGLLAASIAVAFYLVYSALWNFTQNTINYSILLFLPISLIAIGLPYFLVKRFGKIKTTGSGTHTVLEAYHLTNGEIGLSDTIVKPASSIVTIGLGGSAGPEGPSLLVGGGIAAAVSRHVKVESDLRRRLFIAGAAAGLAATFRTPLTGILFALEIPYKNDLDRETFIEAVMASVPAYLLSLAILGSEPFFGAIYNASLTFNEIILSMLLGLICGLYAIFFTKTFAWFGRVGEKLQKKIGNIGVIVTGALLLSLCGILSVYTIGVGLHFVEALIQGTTFSIATLILVILLKTFATSVTLNFGGSGGLFFPTIVIGAGIGYIFSSLLSVDLTIVFVAVGMAALLAGTHKMLLTPVAFVVETLGGVFAIPALLASGVSYLLSGKHSFFPLQPYARLKTEELAVERFYLKAERLNPKKMKNILSNEFMTKNPVTLHKGTTIKESIEIFRTTKFRVLPVIDDKTNVVGVVNLEDLGYVDIHQQEITLNSAVMHKPLLIKKETTLETAAQMMIETQQDHAFVVDENEQIIGVVSGIDIVKKILEILPTEK